MIQPNAHDVFLSYAREDGERARVLADRLGEHGWSVWWDRDLPPGESFADVTAEALEAARCVVVLWSRASVDSRWVREEAARGQVRQALFPIRMDDVEVPGEFGGVQAATLAEWDGSPSHPQLRAVLSQLESFLEFSGSTAQTGSMKQEANAPPSTMEAPREAASPGPPGSSAAAPPEASAAGPPAEPTPGLPTRIARAVPGMVFLVALAAWGVSAAMENLRSVTVRLSFAPAVHWAVTPVTPPGSDADARSASLVGLDRSGRLGDFAQRGPHRLDAFFLVVEDAQSGDTLAVVESFREDVLLLGADTAAAVSSFERADSTGGSLRALLGGGGLAGAPSGYIREADADVLTQRSVEVSRAIVSGTPIRLTLVRVDWGGGEAVAVATVHPETDCREATGGGGFLGRGRLYDCLVLAGLDPVRPDSAAVVVGGDTLAFLYGRLGPFSPAERAASTEERIGDLRLQGAPAYSVRVVDDGGRAEVWVGSVAVVSVTPEDTVARGLSRAATAALLADRVLTALSAWSLRDLLVPMLLTLLATGALYWLLRLMNLWYPRLYRRIRSIHEDKLPSLNVQGLVLLSGERIEATVIFLARASRVVVTVLLLYVYFAVVFSVFPMTRVLTQRIVALALDFFLRAPLTQRAPLTVVAIGAMYWLLRRRRGST